MIRATKKAAANVPPAGAIHLEDVQLCYPLYKRIVWDRLREVASSAFPSLRPPSKQVLDGISLAVEPGEMLGLLGRNGAGKTTLLKVVSGMLAPSSGAVAVGGRVMALLAMGTGFRGNFTGRENLYYGGLLLGLNRGAMDGLIDDIAAFADLGAALDQPYFTYSSGMRARLGFALATTVPADVVILDETLATGDSRFVSRCYRRIREICESGRTILFVSHNLGEVARMTDRVIVLDGGHKVFDGPTAQGIAHYEESTARGAADGAAPALQGFRPRLDMLDRHGRAISTVAIGSMVRLRLRLANDGVAGARFVFVRVVDAESGRLVGYIMRDRFLSLDDAPRGPDYNVHLATGITEVSWELSYWVAGEGRYLFDVYVGPPVEARRPDISSGRLWHSVLEVTAAYDNPFLKGAATCLEFPIAAAEVSHLGGQFSDD